MGSDVDQFSEGLMAIAREMAALQESPRKIAELAAPKVQALIDADMAHGTGPNGEAWASLKDGSGRVPFSSPRRSRDAMKPKVEAVGTLLRVRVSGWANVHNYSRRPSLPVRQIKPRELPLAWRSALEEAAQEAIADLAPKLTSEGGIIKR